MPSSAARAPVAATSVSVAMRAAVDRAQATDTALGTAIEGAGPLVDRAGARASRPGGGPGPHPA